MVALAITAGCSQDPVVYNPNRGAVLNQSTVGTQSKDNVGQHTANTDSKAWDTNGPVMSLGYLYVAQNQLDKTEIMDFLVFSKVSFS